MKKICCLMVVVLSFISSVFCFCGCSNNPNGLVIYTSFYPIYDFAKKVCGDKATVINLVPSGAEPHDYEISAKERANMEQADAVFVNGLGLEIWIDSSQQYYGLGQKLGSKVKITSNVEGIDLIYADNSTVDPHIWLNINYAKKQMEYIKNVMCEIDANNASYYIANYEKYALIFDGLAYSISQSFEALTQNTIVVTHKAYSYFCREYNLDQIAVIGLNAENEPTPQERAQIEDQIVDLVQNQNMNTLFFEELIANDIILDLKTKVENRTGVEIKVSTISTLEGLTQKQILNGQDYVSIMAENAINIKNALIWENYE